MNLRPTRILLSLVSILPVAGAVAAPSIRILDDSDKHGTIVYSVTCENDTKKILQCTRDDKHCGYGRDTPLVKLAEDACAGRVAATPRQAPADEPPSFESVPARP